jgi:hypothetical protein
VAFWLADCAKHSPAEILAGLLATPRAPASVWFHGRRPPGPYDPPAHL